MGKSADSVEVEVVSAPPKLLTFLIADIRGYTSFTEEHGDAAAARLAAQFAEISERFVGEKEGRVVELRGDEVLAAFPSARQALYCAVEMQHAFNRAATDDLPLRVGVGLDAGEAIPVRGGYRGAALNLAARLSSVAGPGEVFASEGLIHLARKTEGLKFVDRGQVELKGMVDPVRVIQVGAEGEMADDLPPLQQILVTHPNNLPETATHFVGREREIASVSALLRRPDVRLVTLTGPGGTGKTRLALQLGAALLHEFEDGVFFVSLAPLADPKLVASGIAQVLRVMEAGEQPLMERLQDHLRDKQLLLVLDNFEHLTEASSLLPELLESCRQLKILVTSRSILRLSWEHVFEVPTLLAPDPRRLSRSDLRDPTLLSQYEAVVLFLERAQAARDDFAITNDNAPAVAEICYRLDGLPLAIELAAARVRLFPPKALLERLSTRLKILTGGARDAPSRQQTMRDTIDWSYSLLHETEQALFARLSVFAGGCTLEAIESLCESADIFEQLESLVEKSLVRQEGDVDPRFMMLETIREFARERLEESGETGMLQQRHAEYFVELAESTWPQLRGSGQGPALNRLEAEHDNLRTALQWLISNKEADLGMRLAGIWRFWMVRGHLTEGRRWLEALLHVDDGSNPLIRAGTLNSAGNLAWMQGDFAKASQQLEESLELSRSVEDESGVSKALGSLGIVAHQRGEYERARELYEESAAIVRKLGDEWMLALTLGNLGLTTLKLGRYEEGMRLNEEALASMVKLGDKHGEARVLNNMAEGALEHGELAEAEKLQIEALELTRELRNTENIIKQLEVLASVAAARGDAERAARLWGTSEALREELQVPPSEDDHALRRTYENLALAVTTQEEFSSALSAGRSLTPDEAIALAMESEDVRT